MPTALAPFQIMSKGYIGLFGRYGIESGWPFQVMEEGLKPGI
jgi:hypothetical protein